MRNFFRLFLFLMGWMGFSSLLPAEDGTSSPGDVQPSEAVGEDSQLQNIFDFSTNLLQINKLGIPSGEAGYAYTVVMGLVSTDPLVFNLMQYTNTGFVGADEPLSAVYFADDHTIYMSSVTLDMGDDTSSSIDNVKLKIMHDPFIWYYLPPDN